MEREKDGGMGRRLARGDLHKGGHTAWGEARLLNLRKEAPSYETEVRESVDLR